MLVWLLAQAVLPVQLRLGPTPVPTGSVIPMRVQAAPRAHVLVLRATTDGRLLVEYPASDARAFKADEPHGTGMVVAAVSAAPFRLDLLSPDASWWAGAGGVETLIGLVRQMANGHSFDYDISIYTVGGARPRPVFHTAAAAPPPPSPSPPPAAVTPVIVVVQAPAAVAERVVLYPVFHANGLRSRTGGLRPPAPRTSGICQSGVDCPAGTGAPAKAIRFR
jgi:hypothetical protein